VTRPHNSILTVISSVGGFAIGIYFVFKVMMTIWVSLMWGFTTSRIFNEKPKSRKERKTMERRVLRELDTASFMKQQILVRALIKNSMDVKMKSKLELGHISTEEDSPKKAEKKASESETD
jgi:hypothetical protein